MNNAHMNGRCINDTRIVRGKFARSAARYDALADYQRAAAQRLASGLDPDWQPARILDGGCGTGHGGRLLQSLWPGAAVVAVDFALPMLHQGVSGTPLCADLQRLPLAEGSVDLFWSNLALQWCDPHRVAAEAARVLKPGGRLAVATLGPGTFDELRAVFSAIDGYRHTLDFAGDEVLQAAFAAAGFRLTRYEHRAKVTYHADLPALLATVRDLGAGHAAGTNRRAGLMGKSTWARFVAGYETRRTAEGLPLTYDTVYLHAQR